MNDIAIATKNLGHRYGGKWAVRDLNLEIPRGTVFGLLGPNGAGKTTTIQMLMGLLPMDSGSVQVLDLDPQTADVEIRQRVGYVADVDGFYEWMKVDDLIQFVATYHRTWNPGLCNELREEFTLDGKAKVRELSRGTRAKLALLLALAFEPEMLILDEPASGVDPAARRNFIETILKHYQESGRTILLSSHMLNDFSGLLDHVAFIREGELEFATSLNELHRRTKRVRLIFEDGVPAGLDIPDATSTRVNGREVIAIFTDFEQDKTLARFESMNATHVLVEDLTLEDVFVERANL